MKRQRRHSFYTHSPVARTFSLRDVQTSRTRMAQGVCSVHVAYLRLAFSTLMFHPSALLFPHGHFDTTFPSAPSSSSITRPKSAGEAHFRTSAEEFSYLTDPTHSTGYEPKLPDKTTSVDGDTTAINDPDHDSISDFSKPHARALDSSVFLQCLRPLFRTFLMMKAKTACIGKPLQDREKERERAVLQSRCQGKVVGLILFRLTKNSVLMNEISENTSNEELNKLFLVKILFGKDDSRLSTTWRSKIWSEEIQNTHYSSHRVGLSLKDYSYWRPINGQITLSEREYICVVNWRLRIVFIRNATRVVVKKLKN